MALLHVEPPAVPPFQRRVQRQSEILVRHSVVQLKIHAADHLGTTAAYLLQPEEVTEEVEVGKNPEIRLTEVNENQNVQDSVWVEDA